MTRLLDQNRRKITAFFDKVRVRYVEKDEVDRFDPRHLSFLNVNTKEDWEQVQSLLSEQTNSGARPFGRAPVRAIDTVRTQYSY